MDTKAFVQDAVSRSLEKYLELHPNDVCVVYSHYPSEPDTQFAEIKSAWDAKKVFLLVGVRGNISPATAVYYDANDVDGERVELLYTNSPNKLVSRPDNSLVLVSTLDDTGWLTLTGEYIDCKYRKKDGVVYITFSDLVLKKEIPVGENILLVTLPADCIPTVHASAIVENRGAEVVGFLVVRPSTGNLVMKATKAVTLSATNQTLVTGFSYPV